MHDAVCEFLRTAFAPWVTAQGAAKQTVEPFEVLHGGQPRLLGHRCLKRVNGQPSRQPRLAGAGCQAIFDAPRDGVMDSGRVSERGSREHLVGTMMVQYITHQPLRKHWMAARILVVDDEPMVRALIVRALTDDGHEVVAVANGRAALDAARVASVGFDLIVTNSYMPGLTGPELVAKVRQDFPNQPILHIDDIVRGGRIGQLPSDIPTVYKPFSVAALKDAVSKLLAGS